MNKSESINVAVAETSAIVRSGVISVLKRLPKLEVNPLEITSLDGLHTCMQGHQPDVLIIDPLFEGLFNVERFNSVEEIETKLENLLTLNTDDSDQESLTQREKEVICCIVKGMTNKEMADQLYLSIHTVITHRRNIARKLQIHSAAGLTIYAIVNKLVDISEVKL